MSPPEYKPEPEPEPVVQVVHTSYAVELLLHCKYLAAKILVFSIKSIIGDPFIESLISNVYFLVIFYDRLIRSNIAF